MTEDEIKKIVREEWSNYPASGWMPDERLDAALDQLYTVASNSGADPGKMLSVHCGMSHELCFNEQIQGYTENCFHVLPDGCDNPQTVLCCYFNSKERLYFRHHRPGKCPDSTYRTIKEGSE